jgi:AraC-like DNA-binding protein
LRIIHRYDVDGSSDTGTLGDLGFGTTYYAAYRNETKRMHGLDVVLLSCIFAGRAHHYLDNEVFVEDGASITVVNYGQRHDIVTENSVEVMNLFIDPTRHPLPLMPGVFQSMLPQLISLHPRLANRSNRVIRIAVASPEPMRETLQLLHRELGTQAYGYQENARHLFSSFLIQLCREAADNGVTRPAADERLERVRALLDERFAERLRLDALAEHAGMSKTYLCRKFRDYTGRSIFEYLVDRRLEAAMLRLRSGNDKIATIAIESGFSDLGYFNRKFRGRLDTTPGEYRNRMQPVSDAPSAGDG